MRQTQRPLKNLVLPRDAGSSMGLACPALRESETIGYACKSSKIEKQSPSRGNPKSGPLDPDIYFSALEIQGAGSRVCLDGHHLFMMGQKHKKTQTEYHHDGPCRKRVAEPGNIHHYPPQ
jgi:hypothetical protein